MESKNIYLSWRERRLLRKAEKRGLRRVDYKDNPHLNVLLSYGLLERCVNDKFLPVKDEYGNIAYNAYQVTDGSLRYRLSLRARFWPELRAWIALALSIIALIISAASLICTSKVQKVELVSPHPIVQSESNS